MTRWLTVCWVALCLVSLAPGLVCAAPTDPNDPAYVNPLIPDAPKTDDPNAPTADTADSTNTTPAGTIEITEMPSVVEQGEPFDIAWNAGPDIVSVEIVGWADGATKAGESFTPCVVPIKSATRVNDPDKPFTNFTWTPPILDTIKLTVKLKGYNQEGKMVAKVGRKLPYRPAVFKNRTTDGVYVWLTHKGAQRVFLQLDGKLVRCYACSGAVGSEVCSNNYHPDRPHDHHGVFHIYSKAVEHVSSFNPAWNMRYSMHFLAGHAIHATSPDCYRYLGEPGSHGCVRLHLIDAIDLYKQVNVGTRVEIF